MAQDSIGGLWLHDTKNGHKYMSGQIKIGENLTFDIVVFKNDKGDNDKRPDYRIFKSESRKIQQPDKPKDDFKDDIPF